MISRLKKLFGASGSSTSKGSPGNPGGRRDVILFVDDEPEVRSIARIMLEQQGYKLIEAEDGSHALEVFAQRRREIALVITDVLMPNLDGLGLATRLHKQEPELPILLLSGHVLEEDLWAPGNSKLRYLMKPYRLTDLHGAVVDLIGSPQGSDAPQPPESPS